MNDFLNGLLSNEAFQSLLATIVVAMLSYITNATVNWINTKKVADNEDSKNRILNRVLNTVEIAVKATNQTFTDVLKAEDSFDEEARGKALELTVQTFKELIDEEGMNFVAKTTEDVESYIIKLIESKIKEMK